MSLSESCYERDGFVVCKTVNRLEIERPNGFRSFLWGVAVIAVLLSLAIGPGLLILAVIYIAVQALVSKLQDGENAIDGIVIKRDEFEVMPHATLFPSFSKQGGRTSEIGRAYYRTDRVRPGRAALIEVKRIVIPAGQQFTLEVPGSSPDSDRTCNWLVGEINNWLNQHQRGH